MKQCPFCAEDISESALKCRHCSEWLGQKPKSGDPLDEKFDDLYHRKVADEIRDGVENSLRKKYTWLGLLAIFLSGGGILLLVNNVLSGAQTNVAVAEALQKRSLRTLDDIDTSLKKIVKIESDMEQINRKAAAADQKFSSFEEFSKSGLGVSETLKQEISKLNQIVAMLARTSLPKSAETDAVLSSVQEIDNALAGSKRDIDRAAQKIEYSKFPVEVREFKEARQVSAKLIADLKQKGYTAGYYRRGEFDERIERTRTIAIGKNVPAEIAIPVVKAAAEAAPFLTYITFAAVDDDSMIIGGTSQRSVDSGVRPFTRAELAALTNTTQSQNEFHDKIRRLYGAAPVAR